MDYDTRSQAYRIRLTPPDDVKKHSELLQKMLKLAHDGG
jgi:hypothetical protein